MYIVTFLRTHITTQFHLFHPGVIHRSYVEFFELSCAVVYVPVHTCKVMYMYVYVLDVNGEENIGAEICMHRYVYVTYAYKQTSVCTLAHTHALGGNTRTHEKQAYIH
jgi:hypothetical protein